MYMYIYISNISIIIKLLTEDQTLQNMNIDIKEIVTEACLIQRSVHEAAYSILSNLNLERILVAKYFVYTNLPEKTV